MVRPVESGGGAASAPYISIAQEMAELKRHINEQRKQALARQQRIAAQAEAQKAKTRTQEARQKANTALTKYDKQVKKHQDKWAEANAGVFRTQAAAQAAWKADWEKSKEGKNALAALAPDLQAYDQAVADELRVAAENGGGSIKGAVGKKADELRDSGKSGNWNDDVLDDRVTQIEDVVAKESPETRASAMAADDWLTANDQLSYAQGELAKAQKANAGTLIEYWNTKVNTARNDVDAATTTLADTLGDEFDVVAANVLDVPVSQVPDALEGMTDPQFDKIMKNLKANHPDDPVLGLWIDMVGQSRKFDRDVTVQAKEVQTTLTDIGNNLDDLTPLERQMWDEGDRATLAFLKLGGIDLSMGTDGKLDITVNGKPVELSPLEQKLLENDKDHDPDLRLVSLMLLGGIRVDEITIEGKPTAVFTLDGDRMMPVQQQDGTVEWLRFRESGDGGWVPVQQDPQGNWVTALQKDGKWVFVQKNDTGQWVEATQNKKGEWVPTEGGAALPVLKDFGAFNVNDQLLQQAASDGSGKALSNLSYSLLPYMNLSPDQQVLMDATSLVRLTDTKDLVQARMEVGDEAGAMSVLTSNMDAAFSPEERQRIWNDVGLNFLGRDFILKHINELTAKPNSDPSVQDSETLQERQDSTSYADKIGKWMQEILNDAPPEFADLLLDVVKQESRKDWQLSNNSTASTDRGLDFYKGLSRAVELAPDRAPEFAEWLTDTDSAAYWVIPSLHQQSFLTTVRSTISEGDGAALSAAIADNLARTEGGGGRYSEFQQAYDIGYEEWGQDEAKTINRLNFEDFESNPGRIVNPYFDNILNGTWNVTEFQSLNGHQGKYWLQNFIGTAHGWAPDNAEAAAASDHDQQWFTNVQYAMQIDLIAGWIKKESGDDWKIRAIPVIYASERDGYTYGSLFQLQSPDGEDEVVIDGLVAPQVAAKALGNPMDPNDDQKVDDDEVPYKYSSLRNFQDDNHLSEDGKIYLPYELVADMDPHGLKRFEDNSNIAVIDAARYTGWEKAKFRISVALLPIGLLAAPFTGFQSLWLSAPAWAVLGGSALWGLGVSVEDLVRMKGHGQTISLSNAQARSAWIGAVGSVAGAQSSFLRILNKFGGLNALSGFSRNLALAGGIRGDAVRLQLGLAGGGFVRNSPSVVMASDVLAVGTGGYLTIEQAGSLAANYDSMSDREREEGGIMAAVGAVQLLLGIVGLRQPMVLEPPGLPKTAQAKVAQNNPVAAGHNPNGLVRVAGTGRQSDLNTPIYVGGRWYNKSTGEPVEVKSSGDFIALPDEIPPVRETSTGRRSSQQQGSEDHPASPFGIRGTGRASDLSKQVYADGRWYNKSTGKPVPVNGEPETLSLTDNPADPLVEVRGNGDIVYRTDGETKIIRAGRGSEGQRANFNLARQLERLVLEQLSGMPRYAASSAVDRIVFLGDGLFDFFHTVMKGNYDDTGVTDAFTLRRADGTPLLIMARDRLRTGISDSPDLLHEIIHYHTNPKFVELAGRYEVRAPKSEMDIPPASLNEGMVEYLAWRVANKQSDKPFASFKDYFDAQMARYNQGEAIELAYPYATLIAEAVVERMGGPAVASMALKGDPIALSRFQDAVNGLAHQADGDAAHADYSMDARIRLKFKKPRRPRIAQKAWWTAKGTELATFGHNQKVLWNGRRLKAQAGIGTHIWKDGYRAGAVARGTQTVAQVVLKGPSKGQKGIFNVKMAIAARRAQGAFDKYANDNGIAADPAHRGWIQDTLDGVVFLGKLAEVFGDIHAHSKTYERRRNYLFRRLSRFEDLTRKVGAFGRIMIGDIPQACGFSHYSHTNSNPLTLKRAQRLDTQNSRAYGRLVKDYINWARQIEKIAGTGKGRLGNATLADEIDTAAMSGNRTVLMAKLDDLRQIKGGMAIAYKLRHMTRYDWKIGAYNDPFLAIRSDYSITGFNPGAADAATYVEGRLLNKKYLSQAKALGELTLQKELVAIMLRGEATLLPHKGIPQFKAFYEAVGVYESSSQTAVDLAVLKDKLTTFKGDPSFAFAKTVVGEIYKNVETLERLIADHDGLLREQDAAITKQASDLPRLDADRLTNDTDIANWTGDISTKRSDITARNGDITTLEGENTRRQGELSSNLRQIGRYGLDPNYASAVATHRRAIARLRTEIANDETAIATHRGAISTLEGEIASLESNIAGAKTKNLSIDEEKAALADAITNAKDAVADSNTAITDSGSMIRINLDKFNTDVTEKINNFKAVLRIANKYKLAIVLHCDWGEPLISEKGWPIQSTTDYRYFDQLMDLVQKPEYRDVQFILAHTGFGRLTKPQAKAYQPKPPGAHLSDFDKWITDPANEQYQKIPEHIARLYMARQVAPRVRFDISWNDVGERYVNEPALLKHLVKFIQDNPDAVLFGTDTVKPVNKAQYQQAFHTLYPLYMELARGPNGKDLLWKLLRGNYDEVLGKAQEGTRLQTETELTGKVSARRLKEMNKTIDRLEAGRTKLGKLGREVFDEVLDAWLATNPGKTNTELGGPVNLPARAIAPRSSGADISKQSLSQRGTGAGNALDRGRVMTGVRGIAAGAGVAVTAFSDALFGSHLLPATYAADSIARQIGFFTKLSYKEFVRLSWEAIFEDGKVVGDQRRNIDIFFKRIERAAKLIGADEARLPQIAEVTARYKDDLSVIEDTDQNFDARYPTATPEQKMAWQTTGKQQAIMAATGLYQDRVDRALGAQASSADLFNPFGRIGRILNDAILATAVVNLGGKVQEILDDPAVDGDKGGSTQNYLDLAALAVMAGRLIAENHGGARHTNTLETNKVAKHTQKAVLGALAARGLVGAIDHGMAAYAQHAEGRGIPFGELSKAVSETMITYYGVKAGYFETMNKSGMGGPNPNKLARANQMLVTSLALRAALGPNTDKD
jgi:hypothetical protein